MEICRGEVQIERTWFNNASSPAPPLFHLGLHERKLVCVTSGNSNLGTRLAKLLIRRGYLVRVTVQHPGYYIRSHSHFSTFCDHRKILKWSALQTWFGYGFGVGDVEGSMIRGLESSVVADMKDVASLRRAFRGCHAVFHTSSFIDPWGISGYSVSMHSNVKYLTELCYINLLRPRSLTHAKLRNNNVKY